jgi:phage tail sheath protein FI
LREHIEESVQCIIHDFRFQPVDAQTCASISSAVSNFLIVLWNEGKLHGATQVESFAVSCGVGSTMTVQDVLDGRLILLVKVALENPADFVQITFEQTQAAG